MMTRMPRYMIEAATSSNRCLSLTRPATTIKHSTDSKYSHSVCLQEDMYSYVTVADDQQFKGKGTEVVDA